MSDRTLRPGERMRQSLSFHIAAHYCGELLRSLWLPALTVLIVFLALHLPEWLRISQEAAAGGGAAGVRVEMLDGAPGLWARLGSFFHEIWGGGLALTREAGGAWVRTVVDISAPLRQLGLYLLAVIAADGLRMLFFVRRRHRLDRRVLYPIRQITELTSTLAVTNLAERIDEAAMKNELKDLAGAINGMLDRIEVSYNSEKQFVSDVSHELRTPISVIRGFASMLLRWGKNDPQRLDEGLQTIFQESENMNRLVQNMLFLARHDNKPIMLELSRFDLAGLLREVQEEQRLVTPDRPLTLSPLRETPVEADRTQMKEVVRILLDNALKYSDAGSPIELGVEPAEGGAQLTVQDHGIGISAEDLPRIFDRFFRADEARHPETGGHGLGLSIAAIIVKAHGGRIHVRSKLGEGTCFTVFIPSRPQTAE